MNENCTERMEGRSDAEMVTQQVGQLPFYLPTNDPILQRVPETDNRFQVYS